MKNFEPVYKELENLFINKLPEYIEKTNKEHNDGIILKPFENKSLEENCIKTPSFSFMLEETEYEEKDRIIENTVFIVCLEIKMNQYEEDRTDILWRYINAIQLMLEETEHSFLYTISQINGRKIYIRIIIN